MPKQTLERSGEKLAESAEKIKRSTHGVEDSAARTTELAADRTVFAACRERQIPVAVAMGGGYCPDVDAIVTIHLNTVREAVHSCRSVFVS